LHSCLSYLFPLHLHKTEPVLPLSSWLDIKQQQPVVQHQSTLTNHHQTIMKAVTIMAAFAATLAAVQGKLKNDKQKTIKCIFQGMMSTSNGPLLVRLLRNVSHQVSC
jgi:hypothetical protein